MSIVKTHQTILSIPCRIHPAVPAKSSKKPAVLRFPEDDLLQAYYAKHPEVEGCAWHGQFLQSVLGLCPSCPVQTLSSVPHSRTGEDGTS